MANKDILISQIDQFIIGYGMLPYGGVPSIMKIMQGYGEQAGVMQTLPAEITFTDQDIRDTANYFATKYPGYPDHTYQDWYDMLSHSQYLGDRIIGGGNGNGNGNGNGTTPEPTPTPAPGISRNMLLLGGVILLFLLLPKKAGGIEAPAEV